MENIQDSFEFNGLRCYPNRLESLSYHYIPGDVQPQRSASDRPMVNLIAAGSTGFLQLTTVWDVSPETLEALRNEIAIREGLAETATVKIAFAPVDVKGCSLFLGDGSGEFGEIARSSTSGMPPYSALFNITLNEEQIANASKSLNGHAGFLAIRYDVMLHAPVEVSGRLSGDVTALLQWLLEHPGFSDEDLRARIGAAIEQGLVTVEVIAPSGAPAELVARVRDRLLERATEVLPRQVDNPVVDAGFAELSVSLTEEINLLLEPAADVANWFGAANPVLPAPGPGPVDISPPIPDQPEKKPLMVKLGFSFENIPLALVRVRHGSTEVRLTPPDFNPIEIPSSLTQEASTIILATSYSIGGTVYEREIPVPEEDVLSLTSDDLGITTVSVDARPLQTAGFERARIWLRYRPDRGLIEDERTIYFRDPDWQANWFLITRDELVTGALEYTWKAKTAEGRETERPMGPAASPHIVLTLENNSEG